MRRRAWPVAMRSLRARFLVVVVPLFVVCTLAVFGYVEYRARHDAIAKLRVKLDDLAAIHSAVLSESMWNVADEQIELILAALAIDPDVLGAVVYDEKGRLVTSVGVAGAFEKRGFTAARDIFYTSRGQREKVGRLEVALTDARIRSELKSNLLISAALAGFLLLSIIAIALVGNRRTVGIPLERLLDAINISRETGRRVPVDWSSRDEIGEVVTAFNEMQALQESYERELRVARDRLELRVEERTRELAEKTRALERLSNQLAKFLPPQVYDRVFAGPESARVASTRKKLTVFFSDIAGFTETADRLESEVLTDLVNHYLTEMSRIALGHGATIDKYMGDGIMIFFGDPDSRGVAADALACVRMAIEMRDRMKSLSDEWRESGLERPLQVRMGIHTGYCTVGNFGSEDRLDYTIIGGAANTASRLESAATPGEILISYETYAHVKHEILCREYGEIEVRGLAYPLKTYVVMDSFEAVEGGRKHIHESHPNLTLDLDVDAMDREDREHARTILGDALKTLSDADSSQHPRSGRPRPDESGQ